LKVIKARGLLIGGTEPVKVMGVINLSPESFYHGSIKTGPESILQTALRQIEEGAEILDLGAKSTAPYLETEISPEEEITRALNGLKAIRDEIDKAISIDTTRAVVAKAALENGADIINDVTGLHNDPEMASLAAEFDVPIILGATEINRFRGNPTQRIIQALEESMKKAKAAGIKEEKIILDPDIGFHRIADYKWYKIDAHILMHLKEIIRKFDLPLCIGLSRKSFIGHFLAKKDPAERLYGSLGATALAVLHGASIIRTHDVQETLETIRVVEKIRTYGLEESP